MSILDQYLTHVVEHGASDLHLSSDHPPYWRQHGVIGPLGTGDPLASGQILQLLRETIPPGNFRELQERSDTDCAYSIPGIGRFRVNAFRDMRGYCAVFRHVPERIPTFDELGLPEALRDVCRLSKGLVVVTGPTGCGKSTTLAALVDHINRHRTEHVITIEDPIEFVHCSQKCLINQREVHRDTESFAKALRAALREDPDIVMIGEIRDLETMEIALETAETGHLVFATLHTNAAVATVDRIVDRFPGDRQNQIRSMLADTLKAVVAQVLCPRTSGGRVAAFEVLIVNVPVAAMIREAKTHMLTSVMQTSKNLGMQTFNDELCKLVTKGHVTPEQAYVKSTDKTEMESKLESLGINLAFKDAAAVEAHVSRVAALREQMQKLRAALLEAPDDLPMLSALAWHLATSRYDELRNGKEALRFAERANTIARGKDAHVLAVLGAAQAECGVFRRAIASTRDAIAQYERAGDTRQSIVLALRIRAYESGQSHRES